MENKNMNNLNDKDLGRVVGGNDNAQNEFPKTCPHCTIGTGFVVYWDTVHGERRLLHHCDNCHHAFYFDEEGKIVDIGQWC